MNTGAPVAMSESERYLDIALTKWITSPLPLNRSAPVFQLLDHLSLVLINDHNDFWLQDLLREVPENLTVDQFFLELVSSLNAQSEGDAKAIREHAIKAAALFKKDHNRAGFYRALLEQIFAAQLLLNYSTCLQQSTELLAMVPMHRYPWIEAQAHLEAAICANAEGQFLRGDREMKHAVQLAEISKYQILKLRITGINAFNLFDRGLIDSALRSTWDGLDEYWVILAPPERGYQLYWNLFAVAESRSQWYLAAEIAQEVIASISQTRLKELEALVRYRFAGVAAKAADKVTAKRQIAAARVMLERLRDHLPTSYLTDLQIALAEVELNTGNPTEAELILRNVQAHLLEIKHFAILVHYYSAIGQIALSNHQYGDAIRALRLALDRNEASSTQIDSTIDRLAWDRLFGPVYRTLVESLLLSDRSVEALNIWEQYRLKTFQNNQGSNSLMSHDLSNKAIFQNLGENKAVAIIYAFLPHGLVIWRIDAAGIHTIWESYPQDNLKAIARMFVALCSTPSSDLESIKASASSLYGSLFKAIDSDIPPNSLLLIDADDVLASIPFSVLQDTSGTFLIDRHPLVYSPSIAYSLPLSDSALHFDSLKNILIAISEPSANNGLFHPVYNADAEARHIASHFPGSQIVVEDVNSLAELKRKILTADVFHFIGHGDQAAQQSDLFWAKDNKALLFRKLQLAVFSACSTGHAAPDGVFENDNVVRRFLTMGIGRVVASKWNLDSQVAELQADLFYRKLRSGMAVPEALSRTARDLRSITKFGHPYYWAAFDTYGRP